MNDSKIINQDSLDDKIKESKKLNNTSNKKNKVFNDDSLKKEVETLKEALARERADSINLNNRLQLEKDQLSQNIKELILAKFLPVLDILDKVDLTNIKESFSDNKQILGLASTLELIETTLTDLGISKIEALNQPFDANLHEAVMTKPTELGSEDGKVLQIMQNGYTCNNNILRHAMVIVGQKNN
jgi:molecular chaperone GrpE